MKVPSSPSSSYSPDFIFFNFVANEFQPFLSNHRQTVCLDIIKHAINVEKYLQVQNIQCIVYVMLLNFLKIWRRKT